MKARRLWQCGATYLQWGPSRESWQLRRNWNRILRIAVWSSFSLSTLKRMRNVYICAGFTGHGMDFAFMTVKPVAESI